MACAPYVLGCYFDIPKVDGPESSFSFYQSLLSCMATILIGAIAMYQNRIFNDSNNEEQKKLFEANERILDMNQTQSMGYFVIKASQEDTLGLTHYALHSISEKLELNNLSGKPFVVHSFKLNFRGETKAKNNDLKIFCHSEDGPLGNICFETGIGPIKDEKDVNLEIELELESITGYKYIQVIYADFSFVNDFYQLKAFNTRLEPANRLTCGD